MLERMKLTTENDSPSDLSKSTAIKKTAGFALLTPDPAQFHGYFAADLPAEQAAFMRDPRCSTQLII
jgi:hypothetical protein